MTSNQDLIGKTITGVIATEDPAGGSREIWMLQFSDGSHVEFVSPRGKRNLRRSARLSRPRKSRQSESPQLALNVA